MLGLLLGCALVGYSLLLARFVTRIHIEYLPACIVGCCIVILYFCAATGYLAWGARVIPLLGWLSLLASPLYLRQQSALLWSRYLTPGLVLGFAFVVLMCLLASHAVLIHWDEFTHWGPHAKWVFFHQGFITKLDDTTHATYPLGSALFYDVLYTWGLGYSEAATYEAHMLLLLLPLLPLMRTANWQAWPRTLVSIAIAFGILTALGLHTGLNSSIYMDTAVGIYFGVLLVTQEEALKEDPRAQWLLLPLVMAFTLLRPKILSFVVLWCGILGAQWLATLRSGSRSRILWSGFLIAGILGSAVGMESLWTHYLTSQGIAPEWQLTLSLSNLMQPVTTGYRAQVIQHFLHAMWGPAMGAIIMGWLGIALARYETGTARTHCRITAICLIVGFVGYVISLLGMYLFSYSEIDGLTLVSFGRFLSIYWIGWAFWLLHRALPVVAQYLPTHHLRLKMIACVMVLGVVGVTQSMALYHHIREGWQGKGMGTIRALSIRPIAQAAALRIPPHSHIFIVWQDPLRLEPFALAYALLPRIMQTSPPMVTGAASEWRKRLKQVDYVLIADSNDAFWKQYGSLFPKDLRQHPLVTYPVCVPKKSGGHYGPCHREMRQAYVWKVTNK
ncbi:MAG: hypothetical protein A3J38_09350 [Gammaproteobacteria bacterium RIFCSPHIGHO2_12_FULL_45_9]|nr:MAG: hypothetical protein A3J38_09350 [Gammaproteobacteria bacterium RIFCSPHIGHO2_12_FULL_45_9]